MQGSPTNATTTASAQATSLRGRSWGGWPSSQGVGALLARARSGLASLATQTSTILKDVGLYYNKKLALSILRADCPRRQLQHLLAVATNYEQYYHAGRAMDTLEGRDRWKEEPVSDLYDYKLLLEKLTQLDKARETGSIESMMFMIRSSLDRKIGGMGNPELFQHTHVGTKKLIEEYNDEITKQLDLICDIDTPSVSTSEKFVFFRNVQTAYGRTALLLSGGAIFGLAHLGVCKVLLENKLLPRVISGASVGSIIASVICTKTDEELRYIMDPHNVNLDVFERRCEQGKVLIGKLNRLIKHGVLFDTLVLSEAMAENLGYLTFQEAFNKTRRVLNITVSSSTAFEMPRLLNYLTAPDVLIFSAVAASCAIPFVYRSSPLLAKDKNGVIGPWNPSGHKYIDGSIESDLPALRIAELFNVNHFIVSQVNPHVVKLLDPPTSPSPIRKLTSTMFELMHSELRLRIRQCTDLGLHSRLFKTLQSIVLQDYTGDITIVPDIDLATYGQLVANPTEEIYYKFMALGERACWPHVAMIKNQIQIERTIDEVMYRLRTKRLTEVRQSKLHFHHAAPRGTPADASHLHQRHLQKSQPYSPRERELDRTISLDDTTSNERVQHLVLSFTKPGDA